jgi:glycosyltransferase involved in cell wall biosynthesis
MEFQVSVIMPCHNAGPWIADALRTVADQTLPAHEVIVIDDDSSDDSLAQIERSGVAVKLLRSNARNAAGARNLGIEAATGHWLALLDSDDIWYPNHLARAATLLGSTEHVAFLSNHDWISPAGAPIRMPEMFVNNLPAPRSGSSVDDFCRLADYGFHFGHSTVLYRRSRVREVGMFDVSQQRRHDIDLWLRVIAGGTWVYDTMKSAAYRHGTPGGISENTLECEYYYLRALSKNAERVDSPVLRHSLSRRARQAMGVACADGPPEHYARIRDLAWPHLSPLVRMFYRCGSVSPGLLRWLIQTKRRIAQARYSS